MSSYKDLMKEAKDKRSLKQDKLIVRMAKRNTPYKMEIVGVNMNNLLKYDLAVAEMKRKDLDFNGAAYDLWRVLGLCKETLKEKDPDSKVDIVRYASMVHERLKRILYTANRKNIPLSEECLKRIDLAYKMAEALDAREKHHKKSLENMTTVSVVFIGMVLVAILLSERITGAIVANVGSSAVSGLGGMILGLTGILSFAVGLHKNLV